VVKLQNATAVPVFAQVQAHKASFVKSWLQVK